MNGQNRLDFSPPGTPAALPKRSYRTRKDPFAGEWPGIIEILIANSEVGAKAILDLLIAESPDRFNWTHLRTLQRGIRRWRENEASAAAQRSSAAPLAKSPSVVQQIDAIDVRTTSNTAPL